MHIDLDYSEKPYFRCDPRLLQAVTIHNVQCSTVQQIHVFRAFSAEVRLVGSNMEKSRGAVEQEERLCTYLVCLAARSLSKPWWRKEPLSISRTP